VVYQALAAELELVAAQVPGVLEASGAQYPAELDELEAELDASGFQ